MGHRAIAQTQATAASLSQRPWCRESRQVLGTTKEFFGQDQGPRCNSVRRVRAAAASQLRGYQWGAL